MLVDDISKKIGSRAKQVQRQKWHEELERRKEEEKKIATEKLEKKQRKFRVP